MNEICLSDNYIDNSAATLSARVSNPYLSVIVCNPDDALLSGDGSLTLLFAS